MYDHATQAMANTRPLSTGCDASAPEAQVAGVAIAGASARSALKRRCEHRTPIADVIDVPAKCSFRDVVLDRGHLAGAIGYRANATREISVESDALEAVIAAFDPTVIVMDVEGAETALQPGADLGRVRAIMLETHPHITGYTARDALLMALREAGIQQQVKARCNVWLQGERP
ncbi:MAG: hypothetical protein AAGA70_11295 [Pseudomonadota bacterium]